MLSISSTVSRVVPGTSLTIARSSCNKAFSNVLLPLLGVPRMATGMPCLTRCRSGSVDQFGTQVHQVVQQSGQFDRLRECTSSETNQPDQREVDQLLAKRFDPLTKPHANSAVRVYVGQRLWLAIRLQRLRLGSGPTSCSEKRVV